jgi:rhamnulokinase
MPRFLAFDIGTSAGRAILGTLHDDKLTLATIHRFPNRSAPPFGPLIDPHPNSPDFRAVGDMPARIREFCARTGQPVPGDEAEILRCIFESLALIYRQIVEQLEAVLGHTIDVIHIVGGGSRNGLLNQMTAEATNRPVIAGPAEATAMGNLAAQAMATGYLATREDIRALIRRSSDLKRYDPGDTRGWDAAYERFKAFARV